MVDSHFYHHHHHHLYVFVSVVVVVEFWYILANVIVVAPRPRCVRFACARCMFFLKTCVWLSSKNLWVFFMFGPEPYRNSCVFDIFTSHCILPVHFFKHKQCVFNIFVFRVMSSLRLHLRSALRPPNAPRLLVDSSKMAWRCQESTLHVFCVWCSYPLRIRHHLQIIFPCIFASRHERLNP